MTTVYLALMTSMDICSQISRLHISISVLPIRFLLFSTRSSRLLITHSLQQAGSFTIVLFLLLSIATTTTLLLLLLLLLPSLPSLVHLCLISFGFRYHKSLLLTYLSFVFLSFLLLWFLLISTGLLVFAYFFHIIIYSFFLSSYKCSVFYIHKS